MSWDPVRRERKPMRLFIAVLLLLLATTIQVSSQRTLHVPSEYKTIQLAIWAANDKDTVLVAPGVYLEWDIDFLGKAIVVRGTGGSAYTTIDAYQRGYGFMFKSHETRDSVLEGFTIMNTDTAIFCWGTTPRIVENTFVWSAVECLGASPEVTQCTFSKSLVRCASKSSPVIRYNVFYTKTSGWSVRCENSSPTIEENSIYGDSTGNGISCTDRSNPIIRSNTLNRSDIVLDGESTATIEGNFIIGENIAISCSDAPEVNLINNLICENSGRGLYCSNSNVSIMNCTFAYNGNSGQNKGGAIFCDQGSKMDVTNTLFWANTATQGRDIYIGVDSNPSSVSISYSNTTTSNVVKSSFSSLTWGKGMMYADPQFVDHENQDYHLLHSSPCVEKGTSTAPGVPKIDYEGDARFPLGIVDIGADEFFAHLYHAGEASPGKILQFKILGNPGSPVVLGYSYNPAPLFPPLPIPGVSGQLYLQHPIYLVPIGQIPANGLLTLSVPVPTHHPKQAFPTQALIGLHISNLDVIEIK